MEGAAGEVHVLIQHPLTGWHQRQRDGLAGSLGSPRRGAQPSAMQACWRSKAALALAEAGGDGVEA